MPAYKDKNNGSWYVMARYENWKGEQKQKCKRGFATRREALEWERTFQMQNASDMNMTFEAFCELYEKDQRPRLKESTWATKEHIIKTKLIPAFGKRNISEISAKDIIAWQNELLAYHLRQSFAPGEITPDEANRLGYELAMRFTKGNHSFVVATHTDKAHIHNHIIVNAINLDCDRKFRDFQGSKKALARLSDMICLENGYSVIEHPKNKGKKYNVWLGDSYRRTHRDELRENIDIALMEKPRRLEELLKLLEKAGWEIKRGKHISFRKPEQQRFMRLESLGEEYSEEALNAIFKGNRVHTVSPIR